MPRILIISICIFLTLALGIGLIWPKYQGLKNLEFKIAQKESELKSQEEYLTNLRNISQELKQYQDNLLKIDSALPDGPSLPSLFNFLQKACSQSGLVLGDIGSVVVSSQKESDIKEFHIGLSVSGSYTALKNFLYVLENSVRLIEVENIYFNSEKKEPFSFNLAIKVHSYSEF